MKRAVLSMVLFFVLVFGFVCQASAGNVIDRILKKGVLTVGTTGHYPPFTVDDKNGNPMGFDIDLARMMAEAMDVKLTISEMPITKLFSAIEKNEIDIALAGITITPKRNLRVVFIGPYYVTGQSLLGEKSIVSKVKGPEDMNKPSFKIVVSRGTTGEQVARAMAPKADIIAVKDMETAFKMVIDRKAQALMADEPFCVVMAFRNQDKKLAVSAPFTFEPLGAAMPSSDVLWINWVDNFLMNLNATGKLKELKGYWLADPSWMQRLPETEGLLYKKSAM
ncbi:MAG: hypothetical protein DSZ23_04115 [Thermodesulfatator sp.]|nr:MAG: hypothetical protein DSZ23_04115 [Thermodesulfatator sp.]